MRIASLVVALALALTPALGTPVASAAHGHQHVHHRAAHRHHVAHHAKHHRSRAARCKRARAAHTARAARLRARLCVPAESARATTPGKSGTRGGSTTTTTDPTTTTSGSTTTTSGSTTTTSGSTTTTSGSTTGTTTTTDPTTTTTTPTTTTTTPSSSPTTLQSWLGFGVGNWPTASWRPYSDASPFNQLVGDTAVHPNSATLVQNVLAWGAPSNLLDAADTTNDWSHPTYYAEPTDPIFTLHATKQVSPVEGMKIPIPDAARPAAGGDGHMAVVTPDGWEYDFWQVSSKPAGGGTLTFSMGGRTRIDGDGLRSQATAANFGNLAGMIRVQELMAGHIDHALFIVLKCTSTGTSFGYGTQTVAQSWDGSFVYPATHPASNCNTTNPNLPPAGARFQLAMTDAQIAALAVPTWKKTILTALAHYGGYVGDTGGPGFSLMFESSTTYTSFGVADPLAAFAKANNLPTWNGSYVFNVANGVDWAKYLRVLVPPAPAA